MGAVMGSKNLKAVVVRGSQDVKIADPERFKGVIDAYRKTLEGEVWTETLRRLGTPNLVAHRQKLGIWGARNFQQATIADWEKISGEVFREKYLVKAMGCMGCMVRCRRYSAILDGSSNPLYMKGPEYETINALGAKPYIIDPDFILQAHYLCDEYGIDEHGAASAISMAMELYERGILKKEDVDGEELVFGNGEAFLRLIDKIVYRKGFGDLLAEGTRIMGQRLNAEYYAIHIKGQEVDASDPRSMVTRALTFGVATRGSCHLRGFPYIDEFITPEEGLKYFGTAAVSDIKALEGKGKLVAWSEDWITVANLMGLCIFAWYRSRTFSMLIKRGLDLVTEAYRAATGLPMTQEHLLRCGERVYNLEKLINFREGIGREADYPPQRFFDEAIARRPRRGRPSRPRRLRDPPGRLLRGPGMGPDHRLPDARKTQGAGAGGNRRNETHPPFPPGALPDVPLLRSGLPTRGAGGRRPAGYRRRVEAAPETLDGPGRGNTLARALSALHPGALCGGLHQREHRPGRSDLGSPPPPGDLRGMRELPARLSLQRHHAR